MEKAAEAAGTRRKGRRSAKRTALTINGARVLKPDSLPEGARFKGYEDFIVQDMVIKPWMVPYRRERWLLASGETVVAALPKGVSSHFGPELKRFVLSQYHQGQITVPRLAAQLNGRGIAISFFAATSSKSRLNFLELLRAGRDEYVINEAALAYMRKRSHSRAIPALSPSGKGFPSQLRRPEAVSASPSAAAGSCGCPASSTGRRSG